MIFAEYLDTIREYNLWGKDLNTGIQRPFYVSKITDYLKMEDVVVSVTGVRRSGKTYITRQVLRSIVDNGAENSQTLYINFEDPAFQLDIGVDLITEIYEAYRHFINTDKRAFIVLDEIQNVEGWERWVRRMLETQADVSIIVTGSSSSMMSGHLSTVLAGRFMDVRVYPLSYKELGEFLTVNDPLIHNHPLIIRPELASYLLLGGFPRVVTSPNSDLAKEYLKDLYNSVVIRDIATRHGVRKVDTLKRAVALVMSSCGSYISVHKITNTMKSLGHSVSTATINDFIDHMQSSLLIEKVEIFSYTIKDRMQYPKKVYCVDTGILVASLPRMDENIGVLLENVVFMELLRRYGRDRIYYWKGEKGLEVDFIITDGMTPIEIIQVSWDPSKEQTLNRELRSIETAAKTMKGVSKKLIIGDIGRDIVVPEDVEVVDIISWLDEKNGLNPLNEPPSTTPE